MAAIASEAGQQVRVFPWNGTLMAPSVYAGTAVNQ
jgi:hypothetical protein